MNSPFVLLVDDDADTRELYRLVLDYAGHRVVDASTVTAALHLARHLRPDVLVADWRLPDGDGFSLFEALNERPLTRRIAKVAATGLTLDAADVARARALGCHHVLTKPIDPDRLVQTIALAREQQVARRLRAAARRLWREARRSQGGSDDPARLLEHRHTPDVALILANDEGRYVAANEFAAHLTGYARHELATMSVWDLTPAPKSAAGQALWRHFIDVGTQEGRYPVKHRSGHILEASYVALANLTPGLHLSALSRSSAIELAG